MNTLKTILFAPKSRTRAALLCLCAGVLFTVGCHHTSNYHVTEQGAHKIKVLSRDGGFTYRNGLEEHQGIAIVRHQPVFGKHTEVVIKNGGLTVNGKSYGELKEKDSVTVDGDKVLINEQERLEIASR